MEMSYKAIVADNGRMEILCWRTMWLQALGFGIMKYHQIANPLLIHCLLHSCLRSQRGFLDLLLDDSSFRQRRSATVP